MDVERTKKAMFSARNPSSFLSIRGLLSQSPSIARPSIRLSLSSSFSVLPIMAESTMTVDYCPRWKAPGDRVQVHRKTRSSKVSRDFPQGPRIILRRKSFWNSTVFLRTSKQSRTSNVDVGILTNSGWK